VIKKLEERINFITSLMPVADRKDLKKMSLVVDKLRREIIFLKSGKTNEKSTEKWLEAVDEFLSINYLESKYLGK